MENNNQVKETISDELGKKIMDTGKAATQLRDYAMLINRLYDAPTEKEMGRMCKEAVDIIKGVDLDDIADRTNINNIIKLGECLGMVSAGYDRCWVKSAYDVIKEYYAALLTEIDNLDLALSLGVVPNINDMTVLALYHAVISNNSIKSDMRMNIVSKRFKVLFTAVDGKLVAYELSNGINPIIANLIPRIDTGEVVCPTSSATTFAREVIKITAIKQN